jgi:hypothetical protein
MMPTKNAKAILTEISVTFQCDFLGAIECPEVVPLGCVFVGVVMKLYFRCTNYRTANGPAGGCSKV